MQASPVIEPITESSSWLSAKPLLLSIALIPLLAHALTLEYLGRQLTGIIAGFAWVLPLAVGLLLNAWSMAEGLANFLFGFSPLAMDFTPGYIVAGHTLIQESDSFIRGTKAGLLMYLLVGIYFAVLLLKRHKQFKTSSYTSP